MLANHLRRNVVAYLALIVALTTGTAYAAGLANGSVTTKKLAKNAVTSAKIKKNAVKSADVKNRSLKESDLAAGVVPGASWVGAMTLNSGADPVADPDSPPVAPHTFTLPRPGRLLVTLSYIDADVGCTAGPGNVGLYVDGRPVPNTLRGESTFGFPREMAGVVTVSAGAHTVSIRANCPGGDPIGGLVFGGNAYTLVLGE